MTTDEIRKEIQKQIQEQKRKYQLKRPPLIWLGSNHLDQIRKHNEQQLLQMKDDGEATFLGFDLVPDYERRNRIAAIETPPQRVVMFMPQFARKIEDGSKRQTFRKEGKTQFEILQPLSLRRWEDKPYRSKQRILRDARVRKVAPTTIDPTERTIRYPDIPMDTQHQELFAQCDGFQNADEMFQFFLEQHGPGAIKGHTIHW